MERREKKAVKATVPNFGAWEKKAVGAPTDYSMVFGQVREKKKNQKTDLSEVRRLSLGNETNHHFHPYRARALLASEDPPLPPPPTNLQRRKSGVNNYFVCCSSSPDIVRP
ncbi:uncharacterized protein DS421_14g447190 [Arachis hypogaea]|uniref:RIN4 pathogenic type III effector avirulence factor Avr cleavage site domain-containing protein n=1 Tax=Arachis hypogaea TaxID=3818 RepID=A0A444ZB68_ARAHY|nr:uncharacterized protein DS421_14g447190 [Arachis hypogaea]RYR11433.1 hypothetical protein Ahy_B04g068956 [Arachis hypogaea]